jgi:hypothetical protein
MGDCRVPSCLALFALHASYTESLFENETQDLHPRQGLARDTVHDLKGCSHRVSVLTALLSAEHFFL